MLSYWFNSLPYLDIIIGHEHDAASPITNLQKETCFGMDELSNSSWKDQYERENTIMQL